jgi:AraC-like DNA-binding protein
MQSEFTYSASPKSAAFGEWRSLVCRTYSLSECKSADEAAFEARLTQVEFGGLGVAKIQSTPMTYVRAAEDIRRDGKDSFTLLYLLNGGISVAQCDRQAKLGVGDMVIYHQGRPFKFAVDESYEALTLSVPFPVMSSRVWNACEKTAVPITGRSPNGAFAAGVLRQLSELETLEQISDPNRVAAAAIDIFATTITPAISGNDARARRHDKLLESVKSYIIRNLADPDLDLECIAKKNNLSERTLTRLFTGINSTPIRWMWNQRLNASYSVIAARRVASVTEAAFACGFNDVSHFCRSFKKEFGITPSALLGRHKE